MEIVKLNAAETISGKPGLDRTNSQYKIIFYAIIVLEKKWLELSRSKEKQ